MAKGNDGNFLQHCIEVGAAIRLSDVDPSGGLHIAFTHGMAPFEPFDALFEQPRPGLCRRLLQDRLTESKKLPQCNAPAIVKAYWKSDATEDHYPNSAELLRAIIGTDKLSGGITETNRMKYQLLAKAWCCSNVKPACSSWREEIRPGGVLSCPDDLQMPWLFSMDPMTFKCQGKKDDEYLYRSDMDLLSNVLTRYIKSEMPGVASLFVYNVRPEVGPRFWEFVDNLSTRIGTDVCCYWLDHRDQGRSQNLAGILCSGFQVS